MKRRYLKIWLLLIIPAFLTFSGCQSGRPDIPLRPDRPTQQDAYQTAIVDAAIAEPDEISDRLIPLVEENPALFWRAADHEKQVKVCTWTNWTGYQDYVGQPMTLTREVWVTAVPELQNAVSKWTLSDEMLTLRLEQLLGLPPDQGKTHFVEMWVNPADVFRPCPDAEIDDTRCDLDFPDNPTPEHKAWIENLSASSYGDNGYPWTRLGYTYDWHDPAHETGLSEFVVRAGAAVEIVSFTPTRTYCRKHE